METIQFKVPSGTKAKLKPLGKLSDLLRYQIAHLLKARGEGTAHAKAKHLITDGRGNAATGRDYLKQYAAKTHH